MRTHHTTEEAPPPTYTRAKLIAEPPAPEGLCYVAVGPCCWGKAKTAPEALRNARREGGRGTYTLHLVNDTCEVDTVNGTVYYNSQTPGLRIKFCRVEARSY